MGAAKREMERREECRRAAESIAVRAGLLERCVCGDIKDPGSWDFEGAYKLGNYLMTKGDPLTEPFQGNRREMTDMIKEVGETTPDECHCDYVMAKDD